MSDKKNAGSYSLLICVFALVLLIIPFLSRAQDSWRYPLTAITETRYVTTNYNGGSGANPIATIVASSTSGGGFNVKFVHQDGAIAFQYNYTATDCFQMIPMAITLKKGATVADDRYAIVGMAAICVLGSDVFNMWLVELDRNGNETMTKVYDFQVDYMPGSATDYYTAEAYSNNHSVPLDIKPVYNDISEHRGYIIAGFVTEDIGIDVPFDVIPPISTPQARRQACFLRIDDSGNILWGRTIETGAVPDLNHNWTMANKIIEIPGEGFVFTGQAIQHFLAGSANPYGLPGGILTGSFDYQPPAAGNTVDATITVVDEINPFGCGADPSNAMFVASGNDLLYDPATKLVHFLGSGIQLQGPCCSLGKGRPYLIVGQISQDRQRKYHMDLVSLRLLDFTAIPSSLASTNRPAIVGARIFFEPNNPQNLIAAGYLHNATFPDNGGITGSLPFFLKYNYFSRTVVGSEAQVFPHLSTNYYLTYPVSRTFSPLNNFMNTAGIIDDLTLSGMHLQAFSPYYNSVLSIYNMSNHVVSLNSPYNACYVFSTEVVPVSCPYFNTLSSSGLPSYKLIYTASTPLSLATPDIIRSAMPETSVNCATVPFRPAENEQTAGLLNNDEVLTPSVYPIPVTDVLHLRTTPQSTYRILNAAGQTVFRGAVSREEERIDTKELPSGFYIIQVTEAAGRSTFIKFMKQ